MTIRTNRFILCALAAVSFCLSASATDITAPCACTNIIAQNPKPAPPIKRHDNYGTTLTDPTLGMQETVPVQRQPIRSGTESTTIRTGTQSTTLQTGTQGALIKGQVEQEKGPVNILLLIDASYSMKEDLGGDMQKMDAAKQVLQNVLTRVPSDVNLGLRVFGHKFEGNPSIDCQQTALLVPLGKGNRRSIIEQMRNVKPYGLTPLTYGLRQAALDLAPMQGPKTIILLSDGAETCGGDPCSFIARLGSMGIKLKIDIVGLGLRRDKEAKEQLNCITTVSGGKYYDANTSSELIDSVAKSVNTAIQGRVITKMKDSAGSVEAPPEVEILKPLLGK